NANAPLAPGTRAGNRAAEVVTVSPFGVDPCSWLPNSVVTHVRACGRWMAARSLATSAVEGRNCVAEPTVSADGPGPTKLGDWTSASVLLSGVSPTQEASFALDCLPWAVTG